MDADGSGLAGIVNGLGVTGFDAAGGDFVYTGSTPTTFSELYLGDEPATQLTAAFTSRRELSEPERFVAVSRDGSEVEAWILRPAGLEEGARYPVLLNIHGGPFTQYTTRFLDEFQVLRRGRLRGRLLEPTRLVRLWRGVGTRDPRARRRWAGDGEASTTRA